MNIGLFVITIHVLILTLMVFYKTIHGFYSKCEKLKTHACVLISFSCDTQAFIIVILFKSDDRVRVPWSTLLKMLRTSKHIGVIALSHIV